MKMKELIQSLKNAISTIMGKFLMILKSIVFQLMLGLKQVFLHPLIVAILSISITFVFTARLNEVGALAGFFGKSLKGATIYLSGPCTVDGKPKNPALAEDEVKITGEDLEKHTIMGVIRKTREVVECDTNLVAIDKIPPLSNFKKSPVQIPDLPAVVANKEPEKEPEWKQLLQKTLTMSGICIAGDGQHLPAFLDEKVEVTNVQPIKDTDQFVIFGIKKSDRVAISCPNTSVKWSIAVDKPVTQVVSADATAPVEPEKPTSYLGKTLLVTSTCFPDERTPKHSSLRKILFYPFVNAKIKIIQEFVDKNGKLRKFTGASLDSGDFVKCDDSKFPISYQEYDRDTTKLVPIKPTSLKFEAQDAPPAANGEVSPPAPTTGDNEGNNKVEDKAN
jgi:hypothetical protein